MNLQGIGPVEFIVAPLVDLRPDPGLLQRLSDLVSAGGIRVIDFVLATRDAHAIDAWSDVDSEEFELAGIELLQPGLIPEADIREILFLAGSGGWAIGLVEHTWSSPDQQFRHPGATVTSIGHIPGSIVEAAISSLESETSTSFQP